MTERLMWGSDRIVPNKSVLLKLQSAHESSGNLVTMQMLIQILKWDLMKFLGEVMLLVHAPNFE